MNLARRLKKFQPLFAIFLLQLFLAASNYQTSQHTITANNNCPPGKIGIKCQFDDECFVSPCHGNATCDSSPVDGKANCLCPPGFSGLDCSIDNDECHVGSPCEHGGVCVNTPGSFRCDCPAGFSGPRCEVNIDECSPSPCQNLGTCLDEKGGFRCICQPGFAGTTCEIDIDECAQNPCQNGAQCQDHINSFRCICEPNFWGERCELSSTATADEDDNGLSKDNPWYKCPEPAKCWKAFKDRKCDESCNTAECLYDGNDCAPLRNCDGPSEAYCLKNYANGVCNPECNSASCGWDGADCEDPTPLNNLTQASGLLVIRVSPPIFISTNTSSEPELDLARLLRTVSVKTQTLLKILSFNQIEDKSGPGTIIELIADNRKCRTMCYNSTELIAKFLSAIKTRSNDFDTHMKSKLEFESKEISDIKQDQYQAMPYVIFCIILVSAVCASVMVISVGKQRSNKEKAVTWFPEGFKPVLSSRNRDPTDRKPGRGVSTLQALGGNFFRGFKKNERNNFTDPRELHSTNIDGATSPNGGGIYHEPYDHYDQYGSTYTATEGASMVNNLEDPMTPTTPVPLNPINIEGPHGLTPLMVASIGPALSKEPLGLVTYGTTSEINSAKDNVTDLLNRGAQLNLKERILGETALHLAARHRRADTAATLLERCSPQDVNAQDESGRTPLHTAIAGSAQGVFELLLRFRDTDLNAQMKDGTTPLILAVKVGAYSMLEELINANCEVTKSDGRSRTALHWAAAVNNKDAIQRLLNVSETNKDAQDLAEETPLFLAAKEGAKNAVEELLKNNANKDIRNCEDKAPIDVARENKHFDIARLLAPESEPRTPSSAISVHNTSRHFSSSSPIHDSNSNSNSNGSCMPQKPWKTKSSTDMYVPCLPNLMTPSPDSPFSGESMASPSVCVDKQYKYHYHYQYPSYPNIKKQDPSGVFI